MIFVAATIAMVISLAALWLANQASRQVDESFKDFSQHLAKQVHEAQETFGAEVTKVHNDLRKLERKLDTTAAHAAEHAEKIKALTQRLTALEQSLEDLTASIPAQYRKPVKKTKSEPSSE